MKAQFDQTFAKCDACELKVSCDRKQQAFAAPPTKPFNGIMIVGEAPGQHEVNASRPFVSRNGQLLRAMCTNAGIDLDACWVTNAVLGKPPAGQQGDGPLHKRFPNAIHACLSRLEAEIQHVRPRVILAFGNAALVALTGYEVAQKKRVPFDCEPCNNVRKIGPVYQCAKCKHVHSAEHVWPEGEDQDGSNCQVCGLEALALTTTAGPELLVCLPPQVCQECNARTSKLKPKMIKCPACNGLKTKETTLTHFEHDYGITEVAGMIIPAVKFGWDALGVQHIIATFHPSFLMRPAKSEGSGDKKVMAGQFAAYAVQKHIDKAAALAQQDRTWTFEYEVTQGDGHDAAQQLYELYVDALKCGDEYELAADVETEAWGTAFYCTECGKKTAESTEVCPTDAKYVEDRPCKNCKTGDDDPVTGQPFAKVTVHELRPCELDARELEEVSRIKCIGFASRVLRRVVVCDTRELKHGSPLHAMIDRVLGGRMKWDIGGPHKPQIREPLGIVFHHGTYDVPVIRKLWGIRCDNYSSDTLIKHHEAHADETHTLQHLAARYTYARLWKPPKQKRGAVIHEDFEELCLYNARDCMVTAECSWALDVELRAEGLQELARTDFALQRLAVEMHWNGLPIDLGIAQEIGTEALGRKLIALKELRDHLNDSEFNPNSAIQLREALFVKLGNAIVDWTDGGKTGKRNPSTAKETLVKLEDTPFKRSLLRYRTEDATLRGYFDVRPDYSGALAAIPGRAVNLWDDGRFHVRWKPFGTVTGRFSSSPNCFSADTEVLTPDGWVSIADAYRKKPKVLQYYEDGTCAFVEPSRWTKRRAKTLSISTASIRLRVTPDHDCLVQRRSGSFEVCKAADFPEDRKQIHAGVYTDGVYALGEAEMALLCATQADGTYSGTKVRFSFKKPRKQDRLRWALQTLGIAFREYTPKREDGYRVFVVQREDLQFTEPYLSTKVFNWRVLQLKRASMDLFVAEIQLWDGHTYHKDKRGKYDPFTYSSSVRQNIDVAQAVLSMSGCRAKIREYKSHGKARVNYQIDATCRDYSFTTNRKITKNREEEDVYCLSVPTSHVFVRREGRVMVTNQCQNWPQWLQAMIKAPKGRKIVGADYDQLELRVLAVLCGDQTLFDLCMRADDSRKLEPEWDPHSFVASYVFPKQYRGLKLKDPAHISDKKVRCKCETCLRKNLRDLCKRVIYGLNYGAGEDVVLASIYNGGYDGPPISVLDIRHVKAIVFELFPGILTWREMMIQTATETRELRSAFMHRRREFALGEIPITEIANFPIQSSAADIVNERVLAFDPLRRKIDSTSIFLAQIHDAVYYEVDEDKAPLFADVMTKTLTCYKSYGSTAPMTFSATAGIADNLKEAK